MLKKEIDNSDVSITETQNALKLILESTIFSNAPRMSRLLNFLVDKALTGAVREVSEYTVGIEAFDQGSSYDTNENPIVRVQVGRLRKKLKIYYATIGSNSDVEISISTGSYMPLIRRRHFEIKQCYLFAIHPFKCITHNAEGVLFTQGLNEELMHQLFKSFGKFIVPYPIITSDYANDDPSISNNSSNVKANHLLEGSIQIDTERIRASIRLVDVSAGCITWSKQLDRNHLFLITHQEELANSICCALKTFFIRD